MIANEQKQLTRPVPSDKVTCKARLYDGTPPDTAKDQAAGACYLVEGPRKFSGKQSSQQKTTVSGHAQVNPQDRLTAEAAAQSGSLGHGGTEMEYEWAQKIFLGQPGGQVVP